jgi:hypothetical protein
MNKEELLSQLQTMAAEGQITRQEIEQVFPIAPTTSKSHVKLSQVFSVLGGLIVMVGIIILVAQNWLFLGLGGRLMVTLGSAVVAFALGVILYPKNELIGLVGLTLAAGLAPVGWFVALDSFGIQLTPTLSHLIIAGILFLVYLLVFSVCRHGVVVLLNVVYATWLMTAAVFYMLDLTDYESASIVIRYLFLTIGLAYILLGYSLAKTKYAKVQSFLYFFGVPAFLGAALSLAGWRLFGTGPRITNIWEIVYPALVIGTVLLSIPLKSRSFLLFGSFFLLAYIFKITSKYFADTLGWPIVLVIVGVAFIGVGYVVLHLSRKYLRS